MDSQYRLIRKVLDFRPDAILTAGMLRELDAFPHDMLAMFQTGYADGIVCGMDFAGANNQFSLLPGVFRLQDKFYILPVPVPVSEMLDDFVRRRKPSDQQHTLYLSLGHSETRDGVPREYLDFCFEQPKSGAHIALLHFGEGHHLLPDAALEGGDSTFLSQIRINILDMPVSAPGEATFHPLIFRAVATALQGKPVKSPADLSLLFAITERRCPSMRTVRAYIEVNGGTTRGKEREGIFRELFRCVRLTPKVASVPVQAPQAEREQERPGPPQVML